MKARFLGTHDGSFHADEVTAAALLIVFDCIDFNKIIRTRKLEELQSCEYVCDVGGVYDSLNKRFDHHQLDYDGQLSSAGMVLAYLYEQNILNIKMFNFLKDAFVKGVDDHDNGRASLEIGHCSFSQIISNFIPPSYDTPLEKMQLAFNEAVIFTVGHIRRLVDRFLYIQSCESTIKTVMDASEKVLIFDEAMPWLDTFFQYDGHLHPALFVIMPADSHWKLRGVPPHAKDKMSVRKQLPLAWAGLMGQPLKEASAIEGAIFCHKGRFISIWQTKEDALNALQKVLDDNNF